MPSKVLAFAVLLLLAGCSSQSSGFVGGSAENKAPVIVEINGFPEHLDGFDRFVKSRLSDLPAETIQSQADNDQLRSRLFDEFVQRQLIVREALKKNIVPTEDEIRKAVEEQHQQTSGASSAKGGAAEQSQPTLDGGERREELLNELLTLKYYKSEVLRDVQVTEQEIADYYNKNSAHYQQQNGFYVREIRVTTADEAQKLHQQALSKPNDFAVLAKEHSQAPTAIQGGLMFYEAQQLPPVLAQAITPLKVSEISKVVQSNYGFHIFKLERRAQPRALAEVQNEIKDKLLSDKNQNLINAFKERAMAAAKIKIYYDRLGFNYSGALKAGA